MTLDEMLALLPDNTSGDISAADLRTVVTELHRIASSVSAVFSYTWVDADPSPGAGKVTMDQNWSMAATKLLISETTLDGATVTFTSVDAAAAVELLIISAGGGRWRGTVSGPSVDQGGYREVPVTPLEAVDPKPANNEKVNLVVDMTTS